MRFRPAQFDSRRPCRVAAADREAGSLQRQPGRKPLDAGIRCLQHTAPLYRGQMIVIRGERVRDVVAPRRDFLPYPAFEHLVDPGFQPVPPIGADGRIVAEVFRQTARNAQRDVVFVSLVHPFPVAVAHEAVPDGEPVIAICQIARKGRVGLPSGIVDCSQQSLVRYVAVFVRDGNGKHIDRRRVAEGRLVPRDVHIQMQIGIVADRMVQVQDGALLLTAPGVPPDVAEGEAAALVARGDAGRVYAGDIAVRRVAVPQRHRPFRQRDLFAVHNLPSPYRRSCPA